MRRRAGRLVTPLVLPVLVIFLWWYYTRSGGSLYFPPPGEVAEAFRSNWMFELVGKHVVPSLSRMIAGFLLSVVLGIGLGLALGMSRIANAATKPWLALARSLPGPAVVVMFLVLFGTGSFAKILMITFVSIFPILMNTIDGVRSTEPVLLDAARSYRLTRWEQITKIILPGAMPQISIGVRTSVALAFIVMIVSEYFGGTNGIGYFTREAGSGFAIPDMWSGMVLLGILGIAVNGIVALVQRRGLRWYVGSKAMANKG